MGALLAAAVGALAAFVGAALVRKAISGVDRHRLLEDALLAGGVVTLVAAAAGEQVAPFLDIFWPALGVFLVFGRIGCLGSGCCHGTYAPLGVRYGFQSAPATCLAGVRLFPLQLVEAIWIAAATAGATLVLASDAQPGSAAWCWLVVYSIGRFVLELARGDGRRPTRAALTRAQWIAAGVVGARVGYDAHAAASSRGATVAGIAVAIVAIGWLTRRWWLAPAVHPLASDDIAPWCQALDELEHAARAAPGREVMQQSPRTGLVLALQVDAADNGAELRAYELRRDVELYDVSECLVLSGLVTARLPHHHVLHVAIDGDLFRLWVLVVEPTGVPGIERDAPPFYVLQRARAFTEALLVARWPQVSARRAAAEQVVEPGALPLATAQGVPVAMPRGAAAVPFELGRIRLHPSADPGEGPADVGRPTRPAGRGPELDHVAVSAPFASWRVERCES